MNRDFVPRRPIAAIRQTTANHHRERLVCYWSVYSCASPRMASIIASARRQLARAGKQLTAASWTTDFDQRLPQTCPVDIVVVYEVDRLTRA